MTNHVVFTLAQSASVKLSMSELNDLIYTPQELVPAPGEGRCVMVRDIVCLKSGAAGVAPDADPKAWVAFAFTDISDGELALTPDAAEDEIAVIRPLAKVLPRGDHGRHLLPGVTSNVDYPIIANKPLKMCVVGDEDGWNNEFSSFAGSMSVTLVIRYEVMQIV